MTLYFSIALQAFAVMVAAILIGLVTSWIDRKVTARVQMRVGPPFLQPFYDIAKLMIKETCVPEGAPKTVFLSAPLIGFAGVTLASLAIWRALLDPNPAHSFVGDLIVVMYLLALPAVAVIIGAFSSRNPLASLGGSREMRLMMSYELPLILAVVVPIIHAHSIRLGALMAEPAAFHVSGVIALLVAILCMQAKLTLVPFDSPEAETELAGGAYIEYSGPPLAIFKLTRAMMLFTMPVFLIAVFLGGIAMDGPVWAGILWGVLKYVALVVVVVLIRNTAPRVRIDQATKFFWGPVTVAALAAVVLAVFGL